MLKIWRLYVYSRDGAAARLEERVRVEKNGGTVEWDMLNGVLDVSRAIGDFDRDLGLKTKGLTAQPETQLVRQHSNSLWAFVTKFLRLTSMLLTSSLYWLAMDFGTLLDLKRQFSSLDHTFTRQLDVDYFPITSC